MVDNYLLFSCLVENYQLYLQRVIYNTARKYNKNSAEPLGLHYKIELQHTNK